MRSIELLKDTRIFFLTGNTKQKTAQELMDLGADGVLMKPFVPERLINQIREKYYSI